MWVASDWALAITGKTARMARVRCIVVVHSQSSVCARLNVYSAREDRAESGCVDSALEANDAFGGFAERSVIFLIFFTDRPRRAAVESLQRPTYYPVVHFRRLVKA